jgi:D-glycero-D-manno-heptose 1,7-bisphosphate phosphatase
MQSRPAIFLDKDGTLVTNVPYNVDPARIELSEGAEVALPRLARSGYELVIVSNQSGVARGYFSESALPGVERRLRALLDEIGVPLAGFYYCPHYAGGTIPSYAIECECRKPKPGMLLRAARELDLDPSGSWMIGDILDDVEAGHMAGCRSILLINGGEAVWDVSGQRLPDAVASDLVGAADRIINKPILRGPTNRAEGRHAHA